MNHVAARWRRAGAAILDLLLVALGVTAFAAIVYRLTGARPPRAQLVVSVFAVAAWWALYQYLFLVSTGSTPGLRAFKLSLTNLQGSPVSRRMRRCRALASLLSGASLGLGYVWCLLDEDALCWHDRITHTYLTAERPHDR